MKYRREIDGLRAVAVLAVIFFHYTLLPLPGGFLGVDVFFVISGYLISSLFLKEIETTGGISFSQFYLRRIRRIMPALLLLLIICGVVFSLLYQGAFFDEFAASSLATLFSVSNIFFYFTSGYFELGSNIRPLLHTWSLGIEEQFYLVFPLMVYAVFVRFRYTKRTQAGAIALLFLISLIIFFASKRNFYFYMLPGRFWELLLGTLVALFKYEGKSIPLKFHSLAETIAVAVLALCFCFGQGNGRVWIPAAVFAAAAFVLCGRGIMSRALSTPPFTFTGKISYSLYLWHWPLWAAAYYHYLGQVPRLVAWSLLPACFACAALSWFLVEQKFRKPDMGWRKIGLYLGPLACAALLLSVWGMHEKRGFTFDPDTRKRMKIVRSAEEVDTDSVAFVGPEGPVQFIVLGDSHAQDLVTVFSDLAEEYKIRGAMIAEGGSLMLPGWQQQEDFLKLVDSTNRFISRHDIPIVVFAQRWGGYTPSEKDFERLMEAAVIPGTQALLAQGRQVYLVEDVAPSPFFYPALALDKGIASFPIEQADLWHGKGFKRYVDEADNSNLHFIPRLSKWAADGKAPLVIDSILLYRDADHLTTSGAGVFKNDMRCIFDAIRNTELRRNAE